MDNQYCILGEILGGIRRLVVTTPQTLVKMEAEPGIEPGRPYERGILSPMRLPVSPFGRQRDEATQWGFAWQSA